MKYSCFQGILSEKEFYLFYFCRKNRNYATFTEAY